VLYILNGKVELKVFEKFTERARRVIILARTEAEKRQHEYLGTEHLLLGIVKEGGGVASSVLQNMGISLRQLEAELEARMPPSENILTLGEIPFSPRAKKVLELAVEEARLLGQNYIGTEHLILGITKEDSSTAAAVLKGLGVNLSTLRKETIAIQKISAPKGRETKKETPLLNEFSRDLTQLAKDGKLDPVVGREDEIERVIQILSRRTKNNPVLIGEPGVGKTAIAEGLAQRIVKGMVPKPLLKKRIVALDLGSLVAGTKYRGQFEERLKTIMKEITDSPNIIIFIDELHTIVGAGAAEGSIDASSMLKPALARGEVQCIGATTLNEYRKHIEKDGALERRFQTIIIQPPSVEETVAIIKGLSSRYEAHHRITISEAAIEAAANMADRYITDRYLPDKAIDVLDEAGSRLRLKEITLPPELREMEDKIEEVTAEKVNAIRVQDYELAAHLRDREEKLRRDLEQYKIEWEKKQEEVTPDLTEDDVAYIVSKMTGIPVLRLEETESEKLLRMEDELHKRIVGQDEAVASVTRAIRRSRVGLRLHTKPIGSFIFLGPTGVGKTELAKALAAVLFDDEKALIRLDMSEYMEKFNVSRLTGAPPGYVGYDEGGQLTEQIRRRPYSIVLFDEIEKAHPDVFNILLQVMDNGQLTDNYGRTVSFKNSILIITSNLGTRLAGKGVSLGFQKDEDWASSDKMKSKIMDELNKTFNPEFLNRVDEITIFHALNRDHISKIIDIQIGDLNQQLSEKGLKIELEEDAREWLITKGFDPAFGARHLRRTIQRYIEDPLSMDILKKGLEGGEEILAKLEKDRIVFKIQAGV
jgi:ATP-dependent Clp protease ATP-binding subunit ClpC